MIRFLLTFALSLSLVTQASALSCPVNTAMGDYVIARDSDMRFRIILGQISMPKRLPKRDVSDINEPKPNVLKVRAKIQGKQLGKKTFDVPFEGTVTVVTDCIVAWCGWFPENQKNALMFVREKAGKLELYRSACGGNFYADIPAKEIRRIERCHRGGSCKVR